MYTVGVVLMFPAMVMAMAAGAVFGMLWGTLLVWLGSSVGQTLAFIVGRCAGAAGSAESCAAGGRAAKGRGRVLCSGRLLSCSCRALQLNQPAGLPPCCTAPCVPLLYCRYLLRELVVQYLTRQFPKWTAIDKALESEGWKLVTLLRLSPIAPWNVLNYALSVTAVPLAAYVAASTLAVRRAAWLAGVEGRGRAGRLVGQMGRRCRLTSSKLIFHACWPSFTCRVPLQHTPCRVPPTAAAADPALPAAVCLLWLAGPQPGRHLHGAGGAGHQHHHRYGRHQVRPTVGAGSWGWRLAAGMASVAIMAQCGAHSPLYHACMHAAATVPGGC